MLFFVFFFRFHSGKFGFVQEFPVPIILCKNQFWIEEIMSEKKRGQNFTEKDVQILIKICNKYRKIIECKKTDALTNKDKEDAWQKVTKDFHNLTMDSVSIGIA